MDIFIKQNPILQQPCDTFLLLSVRTDLRNSQIKKDAPIEGPVIRVSKDGKQIPMPGITRKITRKIAPPTFSHFTRQKDASSRQLGSRIHRHLFHAIECKTKCKCGVKTPKKLNQYASQALTIMKKAGLNPVAAEVPILSFSPSIATRLDVVCNHAATNRHYVISLKTGSLSRTRKPKEKQMCLPPFDNIECTTFTLAQLQACVEIMILEQYGLKYLRDFGYLILKTGKNAGLRSLEPWAEAEAQSFNKTLQMITKKNPPKPAARRKGGPNHSVKK